MSSRRLDYLERETANQAARIKALVQQAERDAASIEAMRRDFWAAVAAEVEKVRVRDMTEEGLQLWLGQYLAGQPTWESLVRAAVVVNETFDVRAAEGCSHVNIPPAKARGLATQPARAGDFWGWFTRQPKPRTRRFSSRSQPEARLLPMAEARGFRRDDFG